MLKKLLFIVLLSLPFRASHAQESRSRWVDSVFSTLDREKKVAQLFMLPASASGTTEDSDKLMDLVEDYGIGGIYLTRGGPVQSAGLINKLQRASSARLLVGASAEWGLAQTMDSTLGFQKPLLASVWKNDSLVSLWGKAIAKQMKLTGLHINFAPNVDDEIFPGDYLRYFSNEGAQLKRGTKAFVEAMQSEGIMAVAKHLPRAWDKGPILSDSTIVLHLNQVDTANLSPLQNLIKAHVGGVATSNLHFSMENEKSVAPAAVSQVFISEVLRKKLEFEGLVFSDVRDFQRKAGKIRTGEAELLAFQAGADVLLNSPNASSSIKKIYRLVKKNKLLQAQLDESTRKILTAKYDAGLDRYEPINADNLYRRLHDPSDYLVIANLAAASVTVVQNTDSIVPIRSLEGLSIACLSIGKGSENEFDQYLRKYASIRSYAVLSAADTSAAVFSPADVVILGVFPYATELEHQLKHWIDRLSAHHKVIVAHFGNPLSLGLYSGASSVLAAYTDQDKMPAAVAQVIFGAIPATGALPLTTEPWKAGASVETETLGRLSYSVPEAAGMSSHTLEKIRTIMEEAIAMEATPGCYALIAKDGKVVYEQSAGWLSYEKQQPVTEGTIYDLASMTKVLGTVQVMMFLHEKRLIDINKKASVYLPELQSTNKENLTIKDILTHQSGLVPFIPLWPQTMDEKNNFNPQYYSSIRSEAYPLQVAPDLFASKLLKDSLWRWTLQSELIEKPPRTPYSFRYSDLGPWILYILAERILNQPMDEFLHQNLYEPLGASTTGYLPLTRFDASSIAPTEKDTIFRRGLLTGTVHDERAAMLGGVAGHAGLFSNAGDVAKLGQMLLQKGYYGGHEYFKPETVESFTKKQFRPSRRGLGWDKPMQSDWGSPTSLYASAETYGHTGFTGTCIWIDPEFNLVYVFLSNRVHPNRSSKFNTANIRTRIQEVIYRSMFAYSAETK